MRAGFCGKRCQYFRILTRVIDENNLYIGRNYADTKELGAEFQENTVYSWKPKNALLHAYTFYYPEFTNELHYECELVLRVCA
jgi:2-keto-4-pentenoate hydratase/2-oxohepta-3-ene-1,7-dioic acid hydratase in catechol pathway